MDSLLIETTSIPLPTGYSAAMTHSFEPGNFSNFFYRCGNNDTKTQEVRKYKWVPNGTSELLTTWGEQGILSWASQSTGNVGGSVQPGTEIIGDYLWTGTNYYYDFDKASAPLTVIDWRGGSIEKVIDVSDWWSDINDKEKGQLNGGPNGINQRNGMLYLNCHCSCIKQMVNPAMMDDMDSFYVYTNQNGDYVLDHNYEATSTKAWVCNDYKVGPYTYSVAPENNGFNVNASYDCGAVSFGLLGPDGDGIGYFAFAGDTAGWKWFNIFVDTGGAFDGIYCDDNQRYTPPTGIAATVRGIYYIAHDSIKGVISNQVAVASGAPAAFSVAQNTPNPFNPTTSINFTLAKAGKVTIDVFNAAGQKIDTIANASMTAGAHTVNWNAAKFSAGVYFYTVNANGLTKTMKMTLLK